MARLLIALDATPVDETLIVGAGVGYTAAALAEIIGGRHVHAVDIDRQLVSLARQNFRSAGYNEFLVDWGIIADNYLPALSELSLLTGVAEDDNSRPWSVQRYLRDTGVVTTLSDGNASTVRNNFDREAELARVAAFDYTMRFAYGISAVQGDNVEPSVQVPISDKAQFRIRMDIGAGGYA